jgi:hypothetical protein
LGKPKKNTCLNHLQFCAILQLAQLKILSPLLTLKIDFSKKIPPPHKWRSLNYQFSN